MKKLKLLPIFLIGLSIFLLTGCTTDTMDGINIESSSYPIEYLTKELYSEHATITKLYPDDVNTQTYKITDKLLKDTSEKHLFIYNGLTKEKDIANKLLKINNKIKIIDCTYGMTTSYGTETLWMDPSNMLMVATNIRKGLEEYVTSNNITKEIESNYNDLKIELSQLDAELKVISENSTNKNIVVANDSLKFLNKYGFNTHSLDNSKNLSQKEIYDIEKLFEDKSVTYILAINRTKDNDITKQLKEKYKIEVLYLDDLNNIKEEDRKNQVNLITMFNNNLELIKKETYN